MGKMHWHKASQAQADQGLQISIQEPQMIIFNRNPPCLY